MRIYTFTFAYTTFEQRETNTNIRLSFVDFKSFFSFPIPPFFFLQLLFAFRLLHDYVDVGGICMSC